MSAVYNVKQAQASMSEMLDKVADERLVTITRHGKIAAVMINPDRLSSILESMELMANPKAMKAIKDDRQNKSRVYSMKEFMTL
jgi:PHD/YefM family antitoxin component YafN of YafNO toxin-antitoxin module